MLASLRKRNANDASPSDSLTKRQIRSASKGVSTNVEPTITNHGSSTPTTLVQENFAPKTLTCSVPSSAGQDSMNRKLNFDSSESERKLEAYRRALDPPPFHLDTPPENEDDQALEHKEVVVTQTAERTIAREGQGNENVNTSGASITPVAHEYNKRVVKPRKLTVSPFVGTEAQKAYTVRKSIDTLYSMVCEHG
jgi:hypothetical protein